MAVESQTADDEQTETDGANSQARETAERVADIGLAEVEHVAEDGSLFAVAGVNTLNEGMTDAALKCGFVVARVQSDPDTAYQTAVFERLDISL